MGINRVNRKKRKFSTIADEIPDSTDLTWRAKGVLWKVMTMPDGWVFRTEGLSRPFPGGRDAMRAVFNEIEEVGYLVRWTETDPKTGHFTHRA
jgi:hypothetical protein